MLQPITPRLLALISIASLVACEARRPAAPVATLQPPPPAKTIALDPSQVVAATSSAPAVLPPDSTLAGLPKAIELPGKRACTWRTSAYRATIGGTGTELRLYAGGPVFARVDSGNVAVSVPEGKAGAALIEASSQRVFVSGIADAASVTVFPAKPFVMEGLVVPDGRAELKLRAASNDEVRIKLVLPDEVVVPKRAVEETRPCGDVATDPSTFDSKAPVFGPRPGSHLLMSGGLADLSSRPDGARAATLRIPEGGDFVFSFDEQHGRTLIGWQTSSVMVFGWVRSGRLQHTNVGIGGRSGSGIGRPGIGRITTVASVRCEHDLPLVGEVGSEARTVGRVLAGATVRVVSWGEPRSRVVVDAPGIREQNGRFSARTAELRGCRIL